MSNQLKPKPSKTGPFWIGEICIQTKEIGRNSEQKCGCAFWVAIFIVCLSLCAFQVLMIVNQYLAYEYQTIMRSEDAEELEYPDLLVCTTSGLNLTKIKEEGFSMDAINFFMTHIQSVWTEPVDSSNYNFEAEFDTWLAKKPEVKSLEEAYLYFAYTPDSFIDKCDVSKIHAHCLDTSDKTAKIIMTSNGICYMISPTSIRNKRRVNSRMQQIAGEEGSWSLEINYRLEDNIAFNYSNPTFQFTLINHDQDANFQTRTPIWSSTGNYISVAIKQRNIKKLPKPYGNCVQNDKGFEIMQNFNLVNWTYSREKCRLVCEAKFAMHECNTSCAPPGYFNSMLTQADVCKNETHITCFQENIIFATCEMCKQQCEYTTYDYSHSKTSFDEKNKIIIEIFHEDLVYSTEISTPMVSISGVIGTIGGQLSLWLGFKIATLVQVVYYGLLAVVGKLGGRGQNE